MRVVGLDVSRTVAEIAYLENRFCRVESYWEARRAVRLIHSFQQPERVVGVFNAYRELYAVSTAVLRDIATQ